MLHITGMPESVTKGNARARARAQATAQAVGSACNAVLAAKATAAGAWRRTAAWRPRDAERGVSTDAAAFAAFCTALLAAAYRHGWPTADPHRRVERRLGSP
eukprot:351865-Chlamydomonas_euryale.AAC.2